MRFKDWLHSKSAPYLPKPNDFRVSKVQIPASMVGSNKGLGFLGLKDVSKKTFQAGENPTISRGIPVDTPQED